MTDIEQLKQQLQQQEKLASLGMLSAGIAHEIQNPLNFVINFSKMSNKLLRDLTEIIDDNADKLSDDDREDVADIMNGLHDNMAKIVEHGMIVTFDDPELARLIETELAIKIAPRA